MIRLFALWTVVICALIFILIVREERLSRVGKVPLGRLRRLWMGKDRRKVPRFRMNWPIHYRRVDSPHVYPAKGRDVSQTGAGLLVHERLELGCHVLLEIHLPHSDSPVSITGHVVWTKTLPLNKKQMNPIRLFFIGVKFNPMDPKLEECLRQALEKINE